MDLDYTIAEFVVPRLKLFKKEVDCHPQEFNSLEEWKNVLDKMIKAFDNMEIFYSPSDKDLKNAVEEGLNLFRKHYHDLWF